MGSTQYVFAGEENGSVLEQNGAADIQEETLYMQEQPVVAQEIVPPADGQEKVPAGELNSITAADEFAEEEIETEIDLEPAGSDKQDLEPDVSNESEPDTVSESEESALKSFEVRLLKADGGVISFAETGELSETEQSQDEEIQEVRSFQQGQEVELTAIPEEGYMLKSLCVYSCSDPEEMYDLLNTEQGYVFVMPAGEVFVEAEFVQAGSDTETGPQENKTVEMQQDDILYADLEAEAVDADEEEESAEAEDGEFLLTADRSLTRDEAVAWLNSQNNANYVFGSNGAQSSDFVTAYMNWLVTGNARSGTYTTYNANYYPTVAGWNTDRWEVIQNYREFVPQPGDIFVSTGLHSYGHTGVVITSDDMNATVVDQNAKNPSETDGCPAWIHPITWTGAYSPTYFIRYRKFVSTPVINHNPTGALDSASGSTGSVYVGGWAVDPDDKARSITVHVYVGGSSATVGAESFSVSTSLNRPDINNLGYPGNHGYDATVYTKKTGWQDVYVYAINIGSGENCEIGHKQVYIAADTQKPTIENVRITDISSSGYTVTCKVTDNVKVSRVEFPTWSIADDQDDLIWHKGTIKADGTVTCRINTSDHGRQRGDYLTHIYAWDYAGNQCDTNQVAFPVLLVHVADNISNATVSNVSTKTYTGKAITQNPTVKYGTTVLKKGVDYKISYRNNINVGTAAMIITGIGNYTGTKSVTFTIKKASVPVTGVKLNTTGASLAVGKKTTLKATVSPSGATNKNVTWKSSNTSVATVTSKGVVTAKKQGQQLLR